MAYKIKKAVKPYSHGGYQYAVVDVETGETAKVWLDKPSELYEKYPQWKKYDKRIRLIKTGIAF